MAQEGDKVERRGLMFVMSSPSGAGKTTLSRMLLERNPDVMLSISVTTRPPRPGEIDGQHYHFIKPALFKTMVDDGDLLEYATVFDHSYGTPRSPVELALSSGRDVLFDIDWQGTQQLRSRAQKDNDVVGVFILPPSVSALEQRLRSRAQDSDDVILKRMHKAGDEMSHWDAYDYIVINRDLDEAYENVRAILFAERLKRQVGISEFVDKLRKQL